MIGVVVVYLGFVLACIGLLATVHPLSRLGLTTRSRGMLLMLTGAVAAGIGMSLPAASIRVARGDMHLDRLAPVYQFHEVHAIHIDASPDRVYRAVREVTAGEISLFQLLTRIRRFGRSGPESIVNAPDALPILDVATRTTFLVLADDVPREVVIGTVVIAPSGWRRADAATPEAFAALAQPGFATALMNFRIEPDARGTSLLSTETRVFATDATARRHFAVYWRIIYPGSAIIRRSWLRAIRRRAESERTASVGAGRFRDPAGGSTA